MSEPAFRLRPASLSPTPTVLPYAAVCCCMLLSLLSNCAQAETAEETTIIGTKGRIKVISPAHCPTAIEVTTKANGRGAFGYCTLEQVVASAEVLCRSSPSSTKSGALMDSSSRAPLPAPFSRPAGNITTTRHDFPLPDPPASVEEAGGFNYPNSTGFQFEAEAVYKCIREGRTTCAQYTGSEMITVSPWGWPGWGVFVLLPTLMLSDLDDRCRVRTTPLSVQHATRGFISVRSQGRRSTKAIVYISKAGSPPTLDRKKNPLAGGVFR